MPKSSTPPHPDDPISSLERVLEHARELLVATDDQSAHGHHDDPGDAEPGPAELLRILREPIDWILTVAHRLASGDPDDVAAIDRVRAAFHATLALGRFIAPRPSDVLAVCGILLGALDPQVIMRAVTDGIHDGINAALDSDGSRALAFHLAELADVFAPVRPRRSAVRRRPRARQL